MPYIIALAVIVALGVGFTILQTPKTNTTVTETPDSEIVMDTNPGEETSVTESENDYKNGVHSTQVTYLTPMRDEYVLDISLTLNNDIITHADITYGQGAENNPIAQGFEAAYRSEIIGKDIDSLQLSRVGGASLTTGAFNQALVAIKADAKS